MPMFVKKPIIIEARLFADDNVQDLAHWCNGVLVQDGALGILITTLEGDMRANVGDYIIKGVQDEFYPCKSDIFYATYNAIEEVGTVEATEMK